MKNILLQAAITTTLAIGGFASSASAATIHWTDWQSGDTAKTTAQGTITTPTATITIDYSNANGYRFLQTGNDTNYFTDNNGNLDPLTSPFTSSFVDNIPTAAEMIALENSGQQVLTFSETIANPVFSYVSLNENGYAFDQDFEIVSFGDSSDGNACGYWGCGTSSKQVVSLGNGQFEYRLIGTGEPHGTIRFNGAFDEVSWTSLSDESWNGFTVGVQGTASAVFTQDVPEPTGVLALLAVGAVTMFGGVKKATTSSTDEIVS